ncbi:D-2-hydroxyacid dehydrogenase [Lactobacillus sp. CRM56-3]|uniref:D-2-hydroxyacid dehydrogenase n=1 Tax=Secundilactobacillus folii TaxID=2678357 RepID=A0A7X2XU58_9LACO|nr:D-2-hydroxyacid dehydrogenase [Secundilactobacillus folii]MTV81648.1 D-2-hydroxyacid dehydrogenase [Secundilactobacillus folii]
MKFLFYHARQDELVAVKEWMTQHSDVQVDTNEVPLNEETVELAKGYDGIVIQQHGAISSPKIYQRLHEFGIKQITLRITGYEIIDFKLAAENQLVVTNVPAYSPRSVSELVLADVMYLIRHLGITHERENRHDFTWNGLEANEIHNLTVGIIGAGKIGSAVARIFKALGSTVIAADPIHRPELGDTLTYTDHETVYRTADIVTMHTPLTDETNHMIDAKVFKMMKPTAFLINASRGPVVVAQDLVDALKNHEIAGAGIDTIEGDNQLVSQDWSSRDDFNNPQLDELLKMPNVSVSPHIGFYTDDAVSNMVSIALNDVLTIVNGGVSRHQVTE